MSTVVTGAGHFQIPTAPAGGVSVVSGSAGVLTATAIVLTASTSAMYITGVHVETSAALAATYILVQLCSGANPNETSIGQYLVPLSTASTVALGFRTIEPPLKVAAGVRLTVKTADSVGSKTYLVTAECVLQSNVVDDAIAVTTVTTVTNQLTAAAIATGVWTDTTAGDFTTALSVGKSVMNGITLGTGLTVNDITTKTGYALSSSQTFNITGNITGNLSGSVGSVTGAVGSVTGAVGSVTGLTVANLDTTISSRLATTGYTAPDNTSITTIKAKTDSLAFTVASQADVNIRSVNSVTVSGSGTSGSPWRP